MHALPAIAGRVVKARRPHPVLEQPFQVNVRRDHLLAIGESLRFRQQLVVLVNQRVTIPGQVRGGFARASGRIQVGRNALGRLRRAQAVAIRRLADRDVARGEIGQHSRARKGGIRARRDRRPNILANLHVQREPIDIFGLKNQIIPKRHALAQK